MANYQREATRVLPLEGIYFLASLFFAGVTVVCAQISFRLWYTPVPVTLQVLAVILSGLVLGSRFGALSQIQYLMMGLLGMPVFAEGSFGPSAFAGPRGGYLIGFAAGAYVCGLIFEKLKSRSHASAVLAGCSGIMAIYLFGASWLGVWLGLFQGENIGTCIIGAWQLGVAPFIAIDLLKALIASSLVIGGQFGKEMFKALAKHRQ